MKTKSSKNELLKAWKKHLQTFIDVIDEISIGYSETEACKTYNMNKNFFRSVIFCKEMNDKEYIDNNRFFFVGKTLILTPEERIWCVMNDVEDMLSEYKGITYLDGKLDIPSDLSQTIPELISKYLNESEKTVIQKIFYEDEKLSQAGEQMGITKSRVAQIRNKAVFKLRRHKEYCILGKEMIEYNAKKKQELTELRRDKYKTAVDEQFSKLKTKDMEIGTQNSIVMIPVEFFNLPVRYYNALKGKGVNTIREILSFPTYDDLCSTLSFYKKSNSYRTRMVADDIIEKVHKLGIKFVWELDVRDDIVC